MLSHTRDASHLTFTPLITVGRYNASDGGMSLADIEAWLLRGELRRGRKQRVERITHSWHATSWHGLGTVYRAHVLYWAKWDVASSRTYVAGSTRGLWHLLCNNGIVHQDRVNDDDSYNAWLMLGRVDIRR